MKKLDIIKTCRACGNAGTGKFCCQCGQKYGVERITLKGLVEELFRLLTNLDRGIGYTIKRLILAPGFMQREYIEGDRVRHQKPFSLFLITLTFTALIRYWISTYQASYFQVDSLPETHFFNEYMVLVYFLLLPVYTLIVYLFFYRSGFNYAETGVLLAYTVSMLFLFSALTALSNLIWPGLDEAFIEFPVFAFYYMLTLGNFYRGRARWKVFLLSLMSFLLSFALTQLVEDLVKMAIASF